MILVCTGFHIPFVRLFQAADDLAGRTGEDVLVQGRNEGGFNFRYARHAQSFDNWHELAQSARVLVSHGGIMLAYALQARVPLVAVPRRRCYGEHCNDHQVEFSQWLADQYYFPIVMEMAELPDAIERAVAEKTSQFLPHNRIQLERFLAESLGLKKAK